VDLSGYPLERKDLEEAALRIVRIYAISKTRALPETLNAEVLGRLDGSLSENPDLNIRAWVRMVVDMLDQRLYSKAN